MAYMSREHVDKMREFPKEVTERDELKAEGHG